MYSKDSILFYVHFQGEWLLGPLLDVGELLKRMRDNDEGQSSHLSDELTIVENYVTSNPDHLPAWQLFYNYVILYQPSQTLLKKRILKV